MVSILHHAAAVLLLLWILVSAGWGHPFAFFASLLYLYKVNERYSVRLGKKLQFEERKSANERRLPLDPESVRWLNRVVEKVWPICMEEIASQQFLLPIVPWFLDNYKPWTAKKAAVQHLYLGRTPPIFTEVRALPEPDGDDDMALELGMNFLSAEDMIAVLVIQLRKRLGFGMRAKMHVTGMHVEGKVLVGIKFIEKWPFIGRVRVCFTEPPYFQMTVKPIFHHGVDVAELPGIAGWLDKVVAIAFEESLVEPNMLVVDVEKFASATTESWFTMDEKHPIAFAKVEIIEADGLKPGDISGHATPYVKGQLGPYRFRTKIQRKTLAPKWQEVFKVPISSWEAPNVLSIQVCDKDRMFDDTLGECCVNTNNFKGGQRYDKWLNLTKSKTGRIHLAITVMGEKEKDSNRGKRADDEGPSSEAEATDPEFSGSLPTHENFTTSGSVFGDQCLPDEFEQITMNDRSLTGENHRIRDHRLKNKDRDLEGSKSPGSATSSHSGSSSNGSNGHSIIRRGLQKISNKLHKDPEDDRRATDPERKSRLRDKAKGILKQIEKSADHLIEKVR